MSNVFMPIKIVDLNEAESYSHEDSTLFYTFVFKLSTNAPIEWERIFNDKWNQHIYNYKRRAEVSGSTLQIICLKDELEAIHLPELKKVISEANDIYSESLERDHQKQEEESKRKASSSQDIIDIKNKIKFD